MLESPLAGAFFCLIFIILTVIFYYSLTMRMAFHYGFLLASQTGAL